jgi:hypothetical protein
MNSASSEIERFFSQMAYDLESGKAKQKAAHTGLVNQRKNSRTFGKELKKIQAKEKITHHS